MGGWQGQAVGQLQWQLQGIRVPFCHRLARQAADELHRPTVCALLGLYGRRRGGHGGAVRARRVGKCALLGVSITPTCIVAATGTYACARGKESFSVYWSCGNVMRRDMERDIANGKVFNVYPLAGGRNIEQLYDTSRALRISLTEAQISYLGGGKVFQSGIPMNMIGNRPREPGKSAIIVEAPVHSATLGWGHLFEITRGRVTSIWLFRE